MSHDDILKRSLAALNTQPAAALSRGVGSAAFVLLTDQWSFRHGAAPPRSCSKYCVEICASQIASIQTKENAE